MLESWVGGAGAIVSTLADLAAWDKALAAGAIVTRADYALMSTASTLSNGAPATYGMGLDISERDGHKRVWHGGETNGSTTTNATYPTDSVDIIVFEYSADGDPKALEAAVFDVVFPDAAAATGRNAAGEDLTVRPHVVHLIDEALRGSIPAGEMSPQFQNVANPAAQHDIAQRLARLGAPKAIVFTGKGDRPGATRYTYRVDFASRAVTFVIVINKDEAPRRDGNPRARLTTDAQGVAPLTLLARDDQVATVFRSGLASIRRSSRRS